MYKTCDDTNDNNKRRKDRDLAKITCIEMFSQLSVLYDHLVGQITGKFRRNLCFLIVYIQLHQIDTTSDVFPPPSRLHANN